MDFLKRFFLFWYDFIVGDDPIVALGTVVALALTAVFVRVEALESIAWLPMPVTVAVFLTISVRRGIAH